MDWSQSAGIIAIGATAGILSGMLGIGGAIVIIPALVMFLGYSQHLAQGTTLLMLTLPVSGLAAWQYYKTGNVDLKAALLLGAAFFISGFFGAKLAVHISEGVVKKIFAVLLIIIAVKMLFLDKAMK